MYGPLSKMQVCLNDLQDYPANTNTNDVKKTCKKNPNKSMVTGSITNSSVYHTYQNIQTKSCSCTKIEFFLMPGL